MSRHISLLQEVHGNQLTLEALLNQFNIRYKLFYSGCVERSDENDIRASRGGVAITVPWHDAGTWAQLPPAVAPLFDHHILAHGRTQHLAVRNPISGKE
eukprot:3823696-Pyramimonas_sp.AAC.1